MRFPHHTMLIHLSHDADDPNAMAGLMVRTVAKAAT
jgi:hypothetical protein